MYVLTVVDEWMLEIDLNQGRLILPIYMGVWGDCLLITRISSSLVPPCISPEQHLLARINVFQYQRRQLRWKFGADWTHGLKRPV